MDILDRYIGKIIIESMLLALLVLMAMQCFISFIGELHDIGMGGYGLSQALIYVPMLLPSNIYQFFPMAGLIGTLMGLGRLASQSELIVMQAAGVSIAQVTWAVIKVGILVLIIITMIGEWLGPHAEFQAEARKAAAISGGQAVSTAQGTWVRDGNDFIHINRVLSDGKIQDVMRYQFENHRLVLASRAESGFFKQGQWIFNNVNQSLISNDKISSEHFDQQSWRVNFNPRLLNMSAIEPSQQTLIRLHSYVQYLKQTNQSASQSEFVFWRRVFQPLATLVMICLGVPFIFGPLRTATMGFRILAGIGIGFGFYMLNQFFGPLSMVYQLPPLLAAATPAILFALGGGVLLWLAR